MPAQKTLALIIAGLLTAASAGAEWSISGNPISSPFNQHSKFNPIVVSDGLGGILAGWTSSGSIDPYLQRMGRDGEAAPGWPIGGVCLSSLPADQSVEALMADGAGGAYVVWSDDRNWDETRSDLYALHVLANGQVAPGWPVDGFPICVAPHSPLQPRMALDDSGGVIIAWTDPRDSGGIPGANTHVFGIRITDDGKLAPGWPANGKQIVPSQGSEVGPRLVSDGVGGYLLFFASPPSGRDAFVRHIDMNGEPIPGWASDVMLVASAPGEQSASAVSDGSGGAYLAWSDTRLTPNDPTDYYYYDIYAQHVLADGTIAPGWGTGGVPVCTAPNAQFFPQFVSDGFGGLVICWSDFRNFGTGGDIYGMRLFSDGSRATGWQVDGNPISLSNESHYFPDASRNDGIVADGLGGFYAVFISDFSYRGWAQHMLGDGIPSPGWSALGELVPPQPTSGQDWAVAASDGNGGAYMVWHERRGVYSEIFGTVLRPMGPTSVAVSLVSAEVEPGLGRLSWQVAGTGVSFTLERRTEIVSWRMLATLAANGAGRITYDDRVPESGRFFYRLVYIEEGVRRETPEVQVDVPSAHVLSLAGFTPNPSSSANLAIAFTLPKQAAGSLALFDVTGREIAREDLGGLGPGRHALRLGARSRVPAGVYWMRLTHGDRALTSRGVVVR